MEFARKQLEKWGWKDGNGLGKEMQGMSVALKPHLKTGKEGMGFDLCRELTDTWWTKAYSDSLSRIQVDSTPGQEEVKVRVKGDEEGQEGETRKAKKKGKKRTLVADEDEERPMEKMRKRMMKANFTTFSKGGTLLTNGKVKEDPKSKEEMEKAERTEKEEKVKVLSDEELLKACGGRTAHKAARFGLKLNGKLARIAAQEAIDAAVLYCNGSDKSSPKKESGSSKKEKKKRKKDKRRQQEAEDSINIKESEALDQSAAQQIVQDEKPSKKKRKKEKRSKDKVKEIDSENGSR